MYKANLGEAAGTYVAAGCCGRVDLYRVLIEPCSTERTCDVDKSCTKRSSLIGGIRYYDTVVDDAGTP